MRNWLVLTGLLLAGIAEASASGPAPESGIEEAADTLLIGIPAVALGLTFFLPDEPSAGASGWRSGFSVLQMTGAPRHDLALALLRSTSLTYGLKYAVNAERPNGEDGSFPSGHTSITFAGAEFIRKQYGWQLGAPAYLAAGYVGWSRVETQDHWWHDVAVGAAIGILSNYDLSDLRTTWGDFRVRPALLYGGSGRLMEPDAVAPGLKLELRF